MTTRLKISDVVPDLAGVWLAHFRMAVYQEGLGTRPSGEWNHDPHCGAAAILGHGNISSNWPRCYGGTVSTRRDTFRWSATRRACLATFEHAIRLGLEPPRAARAMRLARRVGRERLGIHQYDMIKIEEWLGLPIAERDYRYHTFVENARRTCLEHHANMSRYIDGSRVWIGINAGYDSIWGKQPLSKEDKIRRNVNRRELLIELADLTS